MFCFFWQKGDESKMLDVEQIQLNWHPTTTRHKSQHSNILNILNPKKKKNKQSIGWPRTKPNSTISKSLLESKGRKGSIILYKMAGNRNKTRGVIPPTTALNATIKRGQSICTSIPLAETRNVPHDHLQQREDFKTNLSIS